MERYGRNVPSRSQMKHQREQLATSIDLAKMNSQVRFHELSTVLEVSDTVDVGTYPRLVKVTPIGDHEKK
ncbi:hypothetical protein IWT25_01755 [Secundilactobacillus pentosiphilus]|uniref:Uncharacterized protein n=1 Tax=Secundilactobacillus pentosiphilus TaxID=1714682 RepID=A0A1Z5IY63_9LACO|nr:hypothetical protein [Secundilactobacillus pentosiphilus]GAX06411.1 hypothetical protein IWT25_01755 [Secundilactobacillus pentosiphilus]